VRDRRSAQHAFIGAVEHKTSQSIVRSFGCLLGL
jgi:hypothetical protein